MKQVLIYGGLMVTLSMGIRHGFGLFNLPMTSANGWGRETFALTIALQNLIWGAVQPVTGPWLIVTAHSKSWLPVGFCMP